ncbi:Inositol phosphorylceramide glucuronosyltransferase 1 [Hibiscus syriacus]|uniref:Hexosyltransferase n=2 Tax=Hibiscus syriacus TaxID=106335 RepID=A0A6A3AYB8_HIBSY|nr:Inositol phosphorylceramide glucuronosyltransferase 1 [Hibiscus syriacus]
MKLTKLISVLFLVALIAIQSKAAALGIEPQSSSKQAYVTLLFGDEYVLGARVLGKSIRDTGTTKDMVALVTNGVSDYSKELLKADGWIVEPTSLLKNPNQARAKRYWGVYTKLKIYNMTTYNKVVYLDADTIVVKNIEEVFKCQKFCANLKHSERMNAGVLVVEPSDAVFKDMLSKVDTLYSYTGGDQGFLTSYYSNFPNAQLFDPNIPEEVMKSRPAPQMERLSILYNADAGLSFINNKWKVDKSDFRVIHYTIGPFKPWDWWTYWLMEPVGVWQNIREQLDESLPGTGGGKNPNDELRVKFLSLFPVCALLFCFYRAFRQIGGLHFKTSLFNKIRHLYHILGSSGTVAYTSVSSSTTTNPNSEVPAYLSAVSVFVCLTSFVVSLAISISIVPRQVTPWTGLLLTYELTFTIFFLLFGAFLHLVYQWGKTANQSGPIASRTDSFDYDSRKGYQRQASSCDIVTWSYGLGMVLLSVAVPSVPYIFGITDRLWM